MSDAEKLGYISPWKGTNVELSYRESEISAWENKSNIILKQARTLFSGDLTMTELLNNYETQLKRNLGKEVKKKSKNVLLVVLMFFVIGGLISYATSSSNNSIEKENNRLNGIYNNVTDKISSKNYDAATLLINEIHWEYNDSWQGSKCKEMAQIWDKKREELKSSIESMKIQNKYNYGSIR
jgi:hypothetical protein